MVSKAFIDYNSLDSLTRQPNMFCFVFATEYQLAKPSDSHRKEMLFGSLAKPNHPMGKFCWGKSNIQNCFRVAL